MKHFIPAVCTAALLASPALADEDKVARELTTWDADSNKMVSLEEWDDTMEHQGLFDRIDKNNNSLFDVEESVDKALDYDLSMDIDAGGHIDRNEFTLGLFNQVDRNGDEQLDETEFEQFAGNAESPLFMTN